jgi:hypothetical protein
MKSGKTEKKRAAPPSIELKLLDKAKPGTFLVIQGCLAKSVLYFFLKFISIAVIYAMRFIEGSEAYEGFTSTFL